MAKHEAHGKQTDFGVWMKTLEHDVLTMDPTKRKRLIACMADLMADERLIVIGFRNGHTIGADATREQIEDVVALQCDLVDADGNRISWEDLWNPQAEASSRAPLLNCIVGDREYRVDRGIPLCDRPPTAVVSVCGGACVRLEYYVGHDALGLVLDLRSAELVRQKLQPYMAEDPFAYDPIAYLRSTGLRLSGPEGQAALRRVLDFHHQITDTYRMSLEEHGRLSGMLMMAAMRHGMRFQNGTAADGTAEAALMAEYRAILGDRYVDPYGEGANASSSSPGVDERRKCH